MKRDPIRTQVRQSMIRLGVKSPNRINVDHYTDGLKDGSLVAIYQHGGMFFWPSSDNQRFFEEKKPLGYLYFHMGNVETLDQESAAIIVNNWVGY